MCVIIHKPANVVLSDETLKSCYDENPDGWGVMFFDKSRGGAVSKKGMDYGTFVQTVKAHMHRELGIHCRIRTHGKIDFENCHPFEVLGGKRRTLLMHNGVIDVAQHDKDRSDTWHFVSNFLRPMVKVKPTLIKDVDFIEMIEKFIGASKLLILNADGEWTIYNEKLGKEHEGCWFSNLHWQYSWTKYERYEWRGYKDYSSYGMAGNPAVIGPGSTKTSNVVVPYTSPYKQLTAVDTDGNEGIIDAVYGDRTGSTIDYFRITKDVIEGMDEEHLAWAIYRDPEGFIDFVSRNATEAVESELVEQILEFENMAYADPEQAATVVMELLKL